MASSVDTPTHVILNIGNPDEISSFIKRIESKSVYEHRKVIVVRLDEEELNKVPSLEEINLFSKRFFNAKCYIVGHGDFDSSYIRNRNGFKVSYKLISSYIKSRYDESQILNPSKKIIFSLLSCNGGSGINHGINSFAGLLHAHLGEKSEGSKSINSEVKARTNNLMFKLPISISGKIVVKNSDESNFVRSVTSERQLKEFHHRAGTKLTYAWDKNGKQVVYDSYLDKIKYQAKKIPSLARELLSKSEILPKIENDLATIENLTSSTGLHLYEFDKLKNMLKKIQKELISTEHASLNNIIEQLLFEAELKINSNSSIKVAFSRTFGSSEEELAIERSERKNFIKNNIIAPFNEILRQIKEKNEEADEMRKEIKSLRDNFESLLTKKMNYNLTSSIEIGIIRNIKKLIQLANCEDKLKRRNYSNEFGYIDNKMKFLDTLNKNSLGNLNNAVYENFKAVMETIEALEKAVINYVQWMDNQEARELDPYKIFQISKCNETIS